MANESGREQLTRRRFLGVLAMATGLGAAVPLLQACAGQQTPAPAATTAPPSGGAAATQAPATPAPKPALKWRLAQVHPEGTDFDLRPKAMAKEVKEKTNGRIDIQVYSGGVLGDWTEAFEQVMRGALEMDLGPVSPNYDPRLNIAYYMPYLVRNIEEGKKAYAKGGYIYNIVTELLEAQGIKGLAVFPLGMAGCTLRKVPPSPGDPDVPKNMKIRVMPLKMCELTYKRLGYIPTAIPYAEAYTAIQTGITDGQMGGPPFQGYQFRDIQGCWIQYNDYQETLWFMLNLKLWQSLSKEEQEILQTACETQSMQRWDYVAKEDEEYRQKMKNENKIEIIMLTDAELQKCADAIRKDVWPEMESIVGKTILDRLYADLGIKT